MNKKKAIVIGAGVAGIAVSIRMALLGFEVKVLEANDFEGGKLSEIQLGKFRFDAGPSLFTMPHLVEELFWLAGKKSNEFKYRKLDEVCRYFFNDGTRFTASSNVKEFGKSVSKHLNESEVDVAQYFERSKLKYGSIGKLFLEKCLRKPSTYLNKRALKAYFNLPALGLFQSLNEYNNSVFKNPKTVQLFNRYATYNGSDPYQTPAVMSMIPHLEFGIGAFFPEGGMIQIIKSLVQLAKEIGVDFQLNRSVQEIKIASNVVKGIVSMGEFLPSDIVVSAIDVSQTYKKLLKMEVKGNTYLNLPKSTSAIIWYLGVDRKCIETGLHNIFFSGDYKAEFDSLFQKREMPSDPTIYLNISSKENPTDAPADAENWFIMVNAPANEGQDWDQIIPKTRQIVFEKLSMELGFDIENNIVEETFLDPRSLEKRTGAIGGALYGSNSNSQFAAFLRHTNYSSQFQNLFFCGGTVHPGGGIPLALQSAAIAAEYVKSSGI
jgi:phytoene desaturase